MQIKKKYLLIIVLVLLVGVFGTTLAYFNANVIGSPITNSNVTTGMYELSVSDSAVNLSNAAPIYDEYYLSQAYHKSFSVSSESTSTINTCAKVTLNITSISNSLRSDRFHYKLISSDGREEYGNFYGASDNSYLVLLEGLFLVPNTTVNFDLYIWTSYIGEENQISVLGTSLVSNIKVYGTDTKNSSDCVYSSPLTISFTPTNNSTFVKNQNVTVTINDLEGLIGNQNVKYGWSNSLTNAPSSYIPVSLNDVDGDNEVSFIASGNNTLNGTYYLWIKPNNSVCNKGNNCITDAVKSGIFSFDNSGPEITNHTVTINDYDANYSITANESYTSINKYYYGYTTESNCTSVTYNESTNATYSFQSLSVGVYLGCMYVTDTLGNRSEVVSNAFSIQGILTCYKPATPVYTCSTGTLSGEICSYDATDNITCTTIPHSTTATFGAISSSQCSSKCSNNYSGTVTCSTCGGTWNKNPSASYNSTSSICTCTYRDYCTGTENHDYSCPSGGIISGTTCSFDATISSYSCDSGTVSGSNCYLYSQTSCGSGWTMS